MSSLTLSGGRPALGAGDWIRTQGPGDPRLPDQVREKNFAYVDVVIDHDADPTGATDSTTAIQAAITAAEAANRGVYFPPGTYDITAALTVTKAIPIHGDGLLSSIIQNTTNDVEAFAFVGATNIFGGLIHDLRINHQAATKYAIRVHNFVQMTIENVWVECASTGFGAVLFGDLLTTPTANSYLGIMKNVTSNGHTGKGFRVNSAGTKWDFIDCRSISAVAGSDGAYINKEGYRISGGVYASAGTGGFAVNVFNTGAGDIDGGIIENLTPMESIASGEYAINIDGTTNSVKNAVVRYCGMNGAGSAGTLVKFGRAKHCRLEAPVAHNPTSGGFLAEWGANSRDCVVECNYAAATMAVTVNGSAQRPLKVVTETISVSLLSNITTAAGLLVLLEGGRSDLLPTNSLFHDGTNWSNRLQFTEAAATAAAPPANTAILDCRDNGSGLTEIYGRFNGGGLQPILARQGGYQLVPGELEVDGALNHDGTTFGLCGMAPSVPEAGWTTFTNLTTDRTCDANATTTEELADILGTLIVALKAKGIIGA